MQKIQRNVIILFTIILISIVIVLTQNKNKENSIPTRGDSIEDVEALGGWWIYVPAAENDKLEGDVYSTFFDEDYSVVNLILPKDINEKKLVFYVRDAADRYAMKCIGDFSSGDLQLGSKTVRLVKSELPFVFISADRSELEALNADEDKTLIPYIEGNLICDYGIDSPVKISPRGNATWNYSKKPYNIEFEQKTNLLGMSANRKWNMLSNYCDLTILSNWVFYDLADRLNLPYTCERMQATVYMNCEYKGVYMFTTKHNVSKNTINLEDGDYLLLLGDPEVVENPDNINYFVIHSDKIDNYSDYLGVDFVGEGIIDFSGEKGHQGKCISVKYPKEDVDIEFIKDFTQRAFEALEDEDSEEYKRYFDIDNLVKFYLIQEFSHNGDAVAKSIYLYYDASKDKLMFGPVWDMDNTLEFFVQDPYDLVANRSWYRSLFLHESFLDALYEIYDNEARKAIYESLEFFKKSADDLETDGELNHKIILRDYTTYFGEKRLFDSYREQCDDKIKVYEDRIEFLDGLLESRNLMDWVDVDNDTVLSW